MNTAADFLRIFWLYRRYQPVSYAIKAAWRIAVQKLPF
mgnify:CR=1 FL=1